MERVTHSTAVVQTPAPRDFLCFKLTKQLCLVGIWISLGLMLEVVGPTLQDLKLHIGANYEEISRALAVKSAGLFAGAFFGGVIHEKFYRHTDLIMSFGILIGAFGIAMVPWSTSLPALAFFLMLTGISEGFVNTGGNTMVMHLWQEKAASPMHSLHFGFAVGAIAAPQIARRFPSQADIQQRELNETWAEYANATQEPLSTTARTAHLGFRSARILYTYSIIGTITLVFAVAMFIFYIRGLPNGFPVRQNIRHFRELFSPASCAFNNLGYGVQLLVLLFIYYIQAVGGERAYGKFLFSFAIEAKVAFTESEAFTLTSVFWVCHMAGRGGGILVARFVPVRYMIAGDLTGSLITTVTLLIFGHRLPLVLWIMTCFMGIFIAILFPSGMSWANLHMQMNSMAVMILMIGGSCGGFIYHYLPGYLFEYSGAQTFMYVMVAYAVLSVAAFVSMECLVSRKGKQIVINWEQRMTSGGEREDGTDIQMSDKPSTATVLLEHDA